jgi:hypothetical protein
VIRKAVLADRAYARRKLSYAQVAVAEWLLAQGKVHAATRYDVHVG